MIIAYIAHPIGGDVEGNLARIREIVKHINSTTNVVPLVPYYSDVASCDDNDPLMRARCIRNDHAIIASGIVNEMWLYGDKISKGMFDEVVLALKHKIRVVPQTIGTAKGITEIYETILKGTI